MATAAAPQVNATDEPEMEEGNPSEHIKAMLLGILLLAGVVVLLIFGYLTFTYRRGGMIPLQALQTQFGTCGQPDVCSCLGYMEWLKVLNSPVVHPCGADISMPGGRGCFEPCLPFVELPDHVQWLYSTH